jgi:hypothetical protein
LLCPYHGDMPDMLAATRPRICHAPAYAYSSGAEAVELAASAGLDLLPWQRDALELGLGETAAGRWAAFQVSLVVPRQNGKDAVFEALGLFWLFVTRERLIGHSAHEYKTAMEAFRRLVGLIENTDSLRKRVKKIINTNGEEGIELTPAAGGGRMRFLARSKGAGRGFSFDKVIWNEAYALTGPQVDAVLPTLSARPNPQLWLGSSPPLDPATGEALFRARRQALAGAAGQVYLDYGADGCLDALDRLDLDDRATWRATNPSYPALISEEAIARERSTMDPAGFARERLGVWPPDLALGHGVIGKEQWDRWIELSPAEPVGRPVFALDVTSRAAGAVRAAIGVAQRLEGGVVRLEHVLGGSGTAWCVAEVARLVRAHDAVGVVVDPGSPAGSLIPELTDAGVNVLTMTTRDVTSAFGMIYDAATDNSGDRRIAHLGQHELAAAVAGAVKRPVGDGHAWDRRNAAVDLTPLVAATHALWGQLTHGKEATPVPWVAFA